jgi:WD40 repeat protein
VSLDIPEWEYIIKTWDLETGKEILTVPAPYSRAEQHIIQYSTDDTQFMVFSYDSQADNPYVLSMLDASNGNLIEETAWKAPAVVPVFPGAADIFLFDRKSLITEDEIWDFSQQKLVAQLRHGYEWGNSGLFLSPDGKFLLIGSGTGELYVMDLSWWLKQAD